MYLATCFLFTYGRMHRFLLRFIPLHLQIEKISVSFCANGGDTGITIDTLAWF